MGASGPKSIGKRGARRGGEGNNVTCDKLFEPKFEYMRWWSGCTSLAPCVPSCVSQIYYGNLESGTDMRVTLVGHAAILIETKGLRILSDPWWEGPCFGTQWWIYPRPHLTGIADGPLDYVYISHGHHDHLHLGTLRRLAVGAKLLVSAEGGLAPYLRERGFPVIEIGGDEEHGLGQGVYCRLMPTCNDDTLLAVDDRNAVCLNLNDALHAAPPGVQEQIIGRLKGYYPEITYAFCGYGIASHFPNCYVVPGSDRAATAARRQAYFNRQWVKIMAALAPRFAFPFAADVVLLEEDHIWANAPVHNSERPTDVFHALHPVSPTRVYDIAPGFCVDGERVVREALFAPLEEAELRRTYAAEYAVANRVSKIAADGVASLAALIAKNIALCEAYLREFSGNYRVAIRLRDADEAILLTKTGPVVALDVVASAGIRPDDYDLIYTTRFAYLRRALTSPYGGEVLYVGSGCLIEYGNRAMVARNLHRELLTLLQYRERAPHSRFGDQAKLVYQAKQIVKRMLGRRSPDLYDLATWVVPSDKPS